MDRRQTIPKIRSNKRGDRFYRAYDSPDGVADSKSMQSNGSSKILIYNLIFKISNYNDLTPTEKIRKVIEVEQTIHSSIFISIRGELIQRHK